MDKSMRTVEAVKGRWSEVLPCYGLAFTNNRHVKCVLCERSGSSGLRINELQGDLVYVCVCSHGSGFNLLMEMTGQSFAEFAKEIDEIIGNTPDRVVAPPKAQARTVDNLVRLQGTDTEVHLRSRGITNIPTVRWDLCQLW